MKPRSAIKNDLFADEHLRKKIDMLGDQIFEIESRIDFAALAAEINRFAPRPASPQGGRLPYYPTETMVRILVLWRLYNLTDEQIKYQLLDHMNYKRFYGLANATNIPDRTTVWTFENRIGQAGAKALFAGVSAQLLKRDFIARGGQIIDATLLPASKQHNRCSEEELIEQGAMPPADWKPAKHQQQDNDATWTKKNKFIPKIETDTASTHDSEHFDKVLDTNNTSRDVYAKRGYPSESRAAWLNENVFCKQIQQRKGKRNKSLSECQQRRSKRISKVCARGEHPLGAIMPMGASSSGSGVGGLCDDEDGCLLQPEAVGLFPVSRNQVLVKPEMARIAAVRSDSKEKLGNAAEKSGDLSKQPSQVRSRSSLCGGIQ